MALFLLDFLAVPALNEVLLSLAMVEDSKEQVKLGVTVGRMLSPAAAKNLCPLGACWLQNGCSRKASLRQCESPHLVKRALTGLQACGYIYALARRYEWH